MIEQRKIVDININGLENIFYVFYNITVWQDTVYTLFTTLTDNNNLLILDKTIMWLQLKCGLSIAHCSIMFI